MKRIYISPEIEIVECVPGAMIATSPLEVVKGDQSKEEEFDGEATGTARGDWSGIWDGM